MPHNEPVNYGGTMRAYRAAFKLQEEDDSIEQVTQRRGRGTLGWIVRFAGKRKGSYIASVILAILNVICGFYSFHLPCQY